MKYDDYGFLIGEKKFKELNGNLYEIDLTTKEILNLLMGIAETKKLKQYEKEKIENEEITHLKGIVEQKKNFNKLIEKRNKQEEKRKNKKLKDKKENKYNRDDKGRFTEEEKSKFSKLLDELKPQSIGSDGISPEIDAINELMDVTSGISQRFDNVRRIGLFKKRNKVSLPVEQKKQHKLDNAHNREERRLLRLILREIGNKSWLSLLASLLPFLRGAGGSGVAGGVDLGKKRKKGKVDLPDGKMPNGGLPKKNKTSKLGKFVRGLPVVGGVLALGYSLAELINWKDMSITERGGALGGAVGSFGGAIAGATAGATIGSAIPVVGTAIGGILGAVFGGWLGSSTGSIVGAKIAPYTTAMLTSMQAQWQSVSSLISQALGRIMMFGYMAYVGIIDFIQNTATAIIDFGVLLSHKAIDFVKGAIDVVKNAVIAGIDGFKNIINSGIDGIKALFEKIKEIASGVGDAVSGLFGGGDDGEDYYGSAEKSDKLNEEQKQALVWAGNELGVDPNYLASVISFETGGTFSTSIRNPHSSATGLIQFMEYSDGKEDGLYYGMTRRQFGRLTFAEQMRYVVKYFKAKKLKRGASQGNVYDAVTGTGYKRGTEAYELNKVWDHNKNGIIEPGESVRSGAFKQHMKVFITDEEKRKYGGSVGLGTRGSSNNNNNNNVPALLQRPASNQGAGKQISLTNPEVPKLSLGVNNISIPQQPIYMASEINTNKNLNGDISQDIEDKNLANIINGGYSHMV